MSPGEIVREKMVALLADPMNGLNPAFEYGCNKRGLPVPLPGDGTQHPFNFAPNSPTFFRMRVDIAWLERDTSQQYPTCITYVTSVRQQTDNRPKGSTFFGQVHVEMDFYIAWAVSQGPPNDDFEAHLDALEESLLVVLNHDCTAWAPIVYANLLDFPERTPITLCNSDQLIRRGLKCQLSALVLVP